MKFTLFIIVLSAGLSPWGEKRTAAQTTGIIVKGRVVQPEPSALVYLKKRLLPGNEFLVLDSQQVAADGGFSFRYDLKETGYYFIEYKYTHGGNGMLLLYDRLRTKQNIDIKIDTSSFTANEKRIKTRNFLISGSPDNDLLNRFFDAAKKYYIGHVVPLEAAIRNLSKEKSDDSKRDSLNTLLKTYKEKRNAELKKIVGQEMGTSIAVYQTMHEWDNTDTNFIKNIVRRFEENAPQSIVTPFIIQKARQLLNTSVVNKPVRPFAVENDKGQQLSVENFVGNKIIFLDFWASWCGPCLKEIPSYKVLFEKYRNRDFVFIGISADEDRDSWINAVKRLQIPWINVIDNKKESVLKKYGVSELPTNFLIDKQGKVIAKNITLTDLDKYLKEQ